jgi:hypothetical protein
VKFFIFFTENFSGKIFFKIFSGKSGWKFFRKSFLIGTQLPGRGGGAG